MARRISEVLGELGEQSKPSFSFEFFPPKSAEGERQLWAALRELEPLAPHFVSVTYGAGGSTQDTTVEITRRIAAETTMEPMGHLTCVGASRDELARVVDSYADASVANILCLRGDPPGGPTAAWTPHPHGFNYASELVDLVANRGEFSIGVAASCDPHPASKDPELDVRVLKEKQDQGAEFAITQLFFLADSYFSLVARARAAGVTIPIIPGIMPVTNLKQIVRFAELSGVEFPPAIAAELSALPEAHVRARGIESAAELCRGLLDGGAPGLHFFTLNRSSATRDIYRQLRAGDA